MKEDRIQIEHAKDHDVQYVRERFKLDQLDGNSLSEYLLGPGLERANRDDGQMDSMVGARRHPSLKRKSVEPTTLAQRLVSRLSCAAGCSDSTATVVGWWQR